MKQRDALLALAKLLAPGDDAIATELAQLFDDRPSYLKKRASALADRNANTKRPPADLPWLALVIALVRVKRVAPIEWKADLPDLLAALDRLVTRPKKASRWAWTKTADVADRSTLELLELVGQHVTSDFELALGRIDIASDSHELFLAPDGHVADAISTRRSQEREKWKERSGSFQLRWQEALGRKAIQPIRGRFARFRVLRVAGRRAARSSAGVNAVHVVDVMGALDLGHARGAARGGGHASEGEAPGPTVHTAQVAAAKYWLAHWSMGANVVPAWHWICEPTMQST